MLLTVTQATFQRQQALFNHRLALLTELSSVVHVEGTSILSKLYDLEFDVDQLPDALSLDQDAALSRKFMESVEAYLGWISHLSVQMNILYGLFGVTKADWPIFVPKADDFQLSHGRRQFNGPTWKAATLDSVRKVREDVIKTMHSMQGVVLDVGRGLEN